MLVWGAISFPLISIRHSPVLAPTSLRTQIRYVLMSENTVDTELEIPDGFELIELTREPIELYKVLKFENAVSSGGEAKMVIGSGLVLVNGQVETQKRKKISTGDTIEFEENKYFIKLSATAKSPEPAAPKKIKPANVNKASRKPIAALRKEGTK